MKTNVTLPAGQASCQKAEKVENLDDIVFEERNRNYGAYYLRSSYNKNVTRALIISVTAILLAALIPFIVLKRAHSTNIHVDTGGTFEPMTQPKDDITPPPPPPPPPVEAIEQRVRCTRIEVTTDDVDDTQALNQDILNNSGNENPVITDEPPIIDVNPTIVSVIQQTAPILIIVEQMPRFDGGEDAMYKWLSENIKFPQAAREAGISGTVMVTFVVEKDGGITNVTTLNKIGGGCEEEAIRVVKLMPKWKEGRQNGVPVRVQFNLPIKFSLEQ